MDDRPVPQERRFMFSYQLSADGYQLETTTETP